MAPQVPAAGKSHLRTEDLNLQLIHRSEELEPRCTAGRGEGKCIPWLGRYWHFQTREQIASIRRERFPKRIFLLPLSASSVLSKHILAPQPLSNSMRLASVILGRTRAGKDSIAKFFLMKGFCVLGSITPTHSEGWPKPPRPRGEGPWSAGGECTWGCHSPSHGLPNGVVMDGKHTRREGPLWSQGRTHIESQRILFLISVTSI